MTFRQPPVAGATLGLAADLGEIPLAAGLELVHTSAQTGSLHVWADLGHAPLPLQLEFVQGELVACRVYDWQGLDALYTFPQDAQAGGLEFWRHPVQAPAALGHYPHLVSEWARLSDEWPRLCRHLLSPSQKFTGQLAPFNRPGGNSARRVAADTGQPLHEVAAQMVALYEVGFIQPLPGRFEWEALVLPPCPDPAAVRESLVVRLLDGHKTLHDLLGRGLDYGTVRSDLLRRVTDRCPVPGHGQLVRDWLWELDAEARDLLVLD